MIRDLAPALHRFEEEGGSDEEIRELFSGVYSIEKIEDDLAQVHKLERAFDAEDNHEGKKAHLYAMALELIVQDVANAWFPDCVIWRANKFDDYKRGTDLFMDMPGPDGAPLTLALDVTSSRMAAKEKVERVVETYRRGKFHDVEYFASDTDDERPRGRAFMPRVVVGASRDEIARLARLYGQWLRHNAIGSSLTKEQALERLQWHELGGQLYEQLMKQVRMAYEMMRKQLKDVPTIQTTKREALKEQARYLDQVWRMLKTRFDAWKKGQAEYLERNHDASMDLFAPPNGVLEAVMQGAI